VLKTLILVAHNFSSFPFINIGLGANNCLKKTFYLISSAIHTLIYLCSTTHTYIYTHANITYNIKAYTYMHAYIHTILPSPAALRGKTSTEKRITIIIVIISFINNMIAMSGASAPRGLCRMSAVCPRGSLRAGSAVAAIAAA
jgi:hypothetical protein